MVKKTKGQTLAEDILSNPKSLPEKDPKLLEKAAEFCEGYKAFLANKTEREVIDYVLPIVRGGRQVLQGQPRQDHHDVHQGEEARGRGHPRVRGAHRQPQA